MQKGVVVILVVKVWRLEEILIVRGTVEAREVYGAADRAGSKSYRPIKSNVGHGRPS